MTNTCENPAKQKQHASLKKSEAKPWGLESSPMLVVRAERTDNGVIIKKNPETLRNMFTISEGYYFVPHLNDNFEHEICVQENKYDKIIQRIRDTENINVDDILPILGWATFRFVRSPSFRDFLACGWNRLETLYPELVDPKRDMLRELHIRAMIEKLHKCYNQWFRGRRPILAYSGPERFVLGDCGVAYIPMKEEPLTRYSGSISIPIKPTLSIEFVGRDWIGHGDKMIGPHSMEFCPENVIFRNMVHVGKSIKELAIPTGYELRFLECLRSYGPLPYKTSFAPMSDSKQDAIYKKYKDKIHKEKLLKQDDS